MSIDSNIRKYDRYTFVDEGNAVLMQSEYSYDSKGQVTASYFTKEGDCIYREPIGKVEVIFESNSWSSYETQKLTEIAKKNLQEISQTFRHIENNKFSLRESFNDGLFLTLRKTHYEAVKKKEEEQAKFDKCDKFIKSIEHRMMYDYFLHQNVFGEPLEEPETPPWYPVKLENNRGVIRDVELPFEACVARLLLTNPYTKIPYPFLDELSEAYTVSRQFRLDFINSILNGFAVLTNGVEVRDYELYYDKILVFKKEGNNVHFYRQDLFRELCSLSNERIYKQIIDKSFISKAIEKGYIPTGSENKLKKFIGHTFSDAIQLETKVYGNMKRVQEINREEIDPLESLDGWLFNCIWDMCDQRETKASNRRAFQYSCSKSWKKIKETYPYLSGNEGLPPKELAWRERGIETGKYIEPAWIKLEKVFKYLSGELEENDLRLTKVTAADLLRITKMFDLALAELNCRRVRLKHYFQRGSYNIRKTILELNPDLSSFDVFSKTLFLKRLINVPYLATPKHWVDRRVGLQARLIANTHILARTLSERLPSLIIGGRGNTATGKSSGLGKLEGTLNTDIIKYGLRKDTDIRNKQIHVEGTVLFDLCFEEIANNTSLHYILDLRLVRIDDLNKYLFEPAKKRSCPVILKDFDAPLLTTLNRVLNRDPHGEDPVPALEPLVNGFKNARKYREDVIHVIEKEEFVKEYTLYHLGRIVAVKEEGQFKIIDAKQYQECFLMPSDQDIEQSLDRIIDEDYIHEAIERRDIKVEDRNCLERWKGKSVRESLIAHANT